MRRVTGESEAEDSHPIYKLLMFLKKILGGEKTEEIEVIIENNFAKPRKIRSLKSTCSLGSII